MSLSSLPYTPYVVPEVPIPDGVPTFNVADYTFIKDIGRGGGGVASKVKNKFSGELFAIKRIVITSDELEDKRHQERIQQDMILATSLNHPNVMRCLGVCANQYGIYFLYNHMPVSFRRKSVKDELKLAEIAYQLLHGLNYLTKEKGLVFKHLTPGNILFDPKSNLFKISDVGIVKDKYIALGYASVVTSFMEFIAPENYHTDNELVDLQSDLYRKSDAWSLGLCLLQLFNNGKYPHHDSHSAVYRYLLSGFSTKPRVVAGDDWPPKAPSNACPLFRDFISSCLHVDVSRRASVDQLLTHPFLVSNGFIHHPMLPLSYQDDGGKIEHKRKITGIVRFYATCIFTSPLADVNFGNPSLAFLVILQNYVIRGLAVAWSRFEFPCVFLTSILEGFVARYVLPSILNPHKKFPCFLHS